MRMQRRERPDQEHIAAGPSQQTVELMIQLFTYVGTPKAVTGFAAAKAVFDELD